MDEEKTRCIPDNGAERKSQENDGNKGTAKKEEGERGKEKGKWKKEFEKTR